MAAIVSIVACFGPDCQAGVRLSERASDYGFDSYASRWANTAPPCKHRGCRGQEKWHRPCISPTTTCSAWCSPTLRRPPPSSAPGSRTRTSAASSGPSLRRAAGSFIDQELRGSASDLLFEVRSAAAAPRQWLYLLFEHQSQPDRWMALRLLRYCCRIWEADRRDYPRRAVPAPGCRWCSTKMRRMRTRGKMHPVSRPCGLRETH